MAGSILNSMAVLRLNFCAKMNICPPKFSTSPGGKTLGVSVWQAYILTINRQQKGGNDKISRY